MTGGDAAAGASPNAAKQIQCALEKTSMNGADATDMPNLIPRYSAQNISRFRFLHSFAVVFFTPCGQKHSLTMPCKLCVILPSSARCH